MTITWGHSFDDFPKRYGRGLEQLMQEHPEFMALGKDGERTKLPSPRGYPQWKYCLSNPELIKAFSEGVNEVFDKSPRMYSTSISPSDGHNWCECPDCLKDTLKIPPQWQNLGLAEPQYTPSVLKFYNAVARLVAEKHPDRVLGALVYQSYLVPPEPPIALEKNLLLGVAMNSGYGFKFYRPERLEAFRKVYSEWGKVAPRLGYTSYSTWMRNWFGFPMPCGREMMKLEFGVLHEHPPEVLHYSGYDAMGYGAATNYVAAKVMWDATADPDVLFREFLERAYGSAAATILEQMDQMVQERLKRFIEATPKTDHEVDYATVKSVFAPIFPQIEEMYFQAVAAKKTDVQQQRLEMLGDNLILAHFNMRNAGLDTLGEKSRFYKTPEQFEAFMASRAGSIGMIDVKAWLKTYGHSYQNMPILTAGWRPK